MKLKYTYNKTPYVSMGYREYLKRLPHDFTMNMNFSQRMPTCINCEVEYVDDQDVE